VTESVVETMVAFHEKGESRKNLSYAGGMKGSFDRQLAVGPELPL
jgi:hypothetical protein